MAIYIPAGTRIELELEDGGSVVLSYERMLELLRPSSRSAQVKSKHIRALRTYSAALRTGRWMGGINEISPERVRLKASDYYNQAMSRGDKFTAEELKLYAQIMEENT